MQSQTIPPEEIIVYSNGKFVDIPDWIHRDCTVIESNKNFGVWARFTIALNATTEYICIFDDDTIPQKKWIESCIEENKKQRWLYGTCGVIFNTDEAYNYHTRWWWMRATDVTREVDLIGHSWFFEKDLLKYYFMELEDTKHYYKAGEDMHFGYVLQKYAGLWCYVPPHPTRDIAVWGSTPDKSQKYGSDVNSTWMQKDSFALFDEFYKYIIQKWFKPMIKRDEKKYYLNIQ